MAYKFYRATPLIAKGSYLPDKWGQTPRIATKAITLVEDGTGVVFQTTDLALKKYKRNKILDNFQQTYQRLFEKKEISIMLLIVDVEKYDTISSFLKDFKRRLRRKNIDILGYVWQRDIGDKDFVLHYHVMLATSRIQPSVFSSLFKNKTTNEYKIELCNSSEKFTKYLQNKEMYSPHRRRNYGYSKSFKPPL